MDYALVIRALERHVGIAERSMQFFRERIMNRQYSDAVIITQEATRALHEVKKQRDLYELQKSLYKRAWDRRPTQFPTISPCRPKRRLSRRTFPTNRCRMPPNARYPTLLPSSPSDVSSGKDFFGPTPKF
jgi:hypothetical protein